MLKVLELDPENVDACLILAELYYNHGNKARPDPSPNRR